MSLMYMFPCSTEIQSNQQLNNSVISGHITVLAHFNCNICLVQTLAAGSQSIYFVWPSATTRPFSLLRPLRSPQSFYFECFKAVDVIRGDDD